MANTAEELILGVDIGGTKVAAALINSRGKILTASRTRMVARKNADAGLQSVTHAIDRVMLHHRAKNVRAIGVSAAGWIDSANGVVLKTTNLPCWQNFPLASRIKSRYQLPVRLANDANAAALAEARWGAGVGRKSVFYVSLGTGLGTGLVLHNRLYTGSSGNAGEGGHVTINFRGPACPCGKRGCVEMYVSGTAITRRARERFRKLARQKSTILQLSHGISKNITSEIVAKAAAADDRLAKEILHETAEYFAIWLGNIINLLDPEMIVLGGGLHPLMMSLLDSVKNYLDACIVPGRKNLAPIVPAFFGANSALIGAAALCLTDFKP